MGYWNSNLTDIEPETLSILLEAVGHAEDSGRYGWDSPARIHCGCEFSSRDVLHLCDYHDGFDRGVELMRTKHSIGR